MSTYHFSLIVDGIDLADDIDLDRVFEVGLDDATPSVIDSVQYLGVTREAASFGQAIASAQRQVREAGGIVRHILEMDENGELRPGLVSLADIARRTGWSREYIRLLAAGKRGPGDFPPPYRDSSPALYSWAEVLNWLDHNLSAAEAAEMVRDIEGERERAGLTRLSNAVLELGNIDPDLWRQARVPERDVDELVRRLRKAVEA